MKRKEGRKEAAATAESLIRRATITALRDPELAKHQAALARAIALKFNLTFDRELKGLFCHGCKKLMIPGLNARVRLGPDKMLLITCLDCGRVNRKKLRARLNMERQGLRNSLRVENGPRPRRTS